jgi:endonuclease-3
MPAHRHDQKRPLDVSLTLERIEGAVKPFPKAALFELAERGFRTPFQQLVACIISIRTRDETSLPVAQKLFAEASGPAQMVQLGISAIDHLIHEAAFHGAKARQIHGIAERVLDEFGGQLPCDYDVMVSFAGVGPKCANLALGIACGPEQAGIGVDIHVHRVTNRWGYVAASTPERTMAQLEAVLPRRHWVDINRLLVPFGKHICTGVMSRCSECPVLDMCQQVGVERHR